MRTFIAGLPPAKAEAVALIKLAEALGNTLREPHSKALGTGCLSCAGTRPGSVLAQMRGDQKDAREWLKKANTEKKR